MNEDDERVEETTENVEEQTTEELVEGAGVTAEDNTEEVKSEEKTYTEADVEKIVNQKVDDLLPKKLERAKSKIERDYAEKMSRLERLENIMKAGMQTEDSDELLEKTAAFYKNQGIEIPEVPKFSERQIKVLGEDEAQKIIDAGYDEIVEEVNRLAAKGLNKMSDIEKVTFQKLASERKHQESIQELNKIGVGAEVLDDKGYKDFSEKLNPNMSEKEKYEMYLKIKPKKEFKQIGSLSSGDKAKEKDYYTPEEVDKLTDKELADDKIWNRVRSSMTKWGKD